MPRMREAIRSGWKTSKSASFSPVDANRIGTPVTCRTDERRATAGVAVELGEHHPGEPDAVAERLGGGHRVLADHRVEHEQGLVRLHGVADGRRLRHQLGVDAEPTRGVDDDDVVDARRASRRPARATATGSPPPTGLRPDRPFARLRREHRHPGLLADHLELGDGVRPLQVGGHQQRGVALALAARAPAFRPASSCRRPADRPA